MKFIKFILVIALISEASLLSVPKKPKKAEKVQEQGYGEIDDIEVEDIPEQRIEKLSNWEKVKNWCTLVQALIKIGALKTADYFGMTDTE